MADKKDPTKDSLSGKWEAKTAKVIFTDKKDKATQRLLKLIRDLEYGIARSKKARDDHQVVLDRLENQLAEARAEYNAL